ncbi:MAG: two-component regulator propeller domain-containing protein, partial [Actinomycetota bacterium]|nr:two-component regulator propeller domain-containing protein [Actinomycetota bacterium]
MAQLPGLPRQTESRFTTLVAAIALIILLAGFLVSACSSGNPAEDDINAPDRLPNDWVTSVATVDDGTVWVGTNDGLGHLGDNGWSNYTSLDGLPNDLVNSVTVADDGTVWTGTTFGAGILDGDRWTRYGIEEGLPSN